MAEDSEKGKQPRLARTIYRHALPVRIMHWINFLCLSLLLLSGFQIFNAHPSLYWGEVSRFDQPLLRMEARRTDEGMQGITRVFDHEFDTTGFLGASSGSHGELEQRAFPAWLTVPGPRWLAMAAAGISSLPGFLSSTASPMSSTRCGPGT